jgi:hypothetical protein
MWDRFLQVRFLIRLCSASVTVSGFTEESMSSEIVSSQVSKFWWHLLNENLRNL